MTKLSWRIPVLLCALSVGCSAPVPVEDAGVPQDAGNTKDSGTQDGGTPDDAGQTDAGVDSGVADAGEMDAGVVDAGCVGTTPARVVFASAPQSINSGACSAALTAQLQTGCGVPVNASANLEVVFSSNRTSTEFFGDPLCIGKPSMFFIAAGTHSLDVYYRDLAPGMSTLAVAAAGFDGGSQVTTIVCGPTEKLCNGASGASCVPRTGCCTDADCTGKRICNASNLCRVPLCQGFVAGCSPSNFVPYDGGTVTIGSPFNPKCVSASSSASVKFSGSLHTLDQSCGSKDLTITKFGSTYTVTGLSSFDTYGLYCATHNSTFEVGAIKHN